MERVFSGIQPTGDLHLGNYLGAVKNWVQSQDKYESIFCIVNSHSLTVPQDPKSLQARTHDLACMLLACGIDPKKSKLFIQSEVNEHAALSWILGCNVSVGELSRMTQFKDKSKKQPKNINAGLFNYPILMAADILLYDVDLVPVGEDQTQHLELTRHIALKFNREFGPCFKVPKGLISTSGARVMGLDDASLKMSKSHKGENHAIYLCDSEDVITRKIKKAVTDSDGVLAFDPTRAGIYNLLCIYEALNPISREAILDNFSNFGYGDFKKKLAEIIIETLRPIQANYRQISKNRDYVEHVLKDGLDSASEIASRVYKRVKEFVGLV